MRWKIKKQIFKNLIFLLDYEKIIVINFNNDILITLKFIKNTKKKKIIHSSVLNDLMNFFNFNFDIKFIVLNSLLVPVGSLIFCYLYALFSDFEQINSYKCGAKNFLPSISTVIGFSHLTYSIWLLTIIYQAPFRILLTKHLNLMYKKIIAKKFTSTFLASTCETKYKSFILLRKGLYLMYLMNNLEILGIFLVSVISSSFNLGKINFIIIIKNQKIIFLF